ncbi:MAG: metallophosphoesterase family protein [bacterium]
MAGDTHADVKHVEYLFRTAQRTGCDTIFVLGDFGYWPRTKGGREFLDKIHYLTFLNDISLYWLDGNHEDHDSLDQMVDGWESFFAMPLGDAGYNERFIYIPRACRWEWDGLSFMAMGGAFSVDRCNRTLGESWFKQEMISDDNVRAATWNDLGVDVMFAHDVPSRVPILDQLWIRKSLRFKVLPEAQHSRDQLEQIVNVVHPDVYIHGHYHLDYSCRVDGTYFRGLDCNGTTGFSWTVFDTEEWNAENPYPF